MASSDQEERGEEPAVTNVDEALKSGYKSSKTSSMEVKGQISSSIEAKSRSKWSKQLCDKNQQNSGRQKLTCTNADRPKSTPKLSKLLSSPIIGEKKQGPEEVKSTSKWSKLLAVEEHEEDSPTKRRVTKPNSKWSEILSKQNPEETKHGSGKSSRMRNIMGKLKSKESAADITRRAIHKLKEKSKANAVLASYYILDSWDGRLSNGLGVNSKRSPLIFGVFKLQTSEKWKFLNIFAIFSHSLVPLSGISFFTAIISLLCILVYLADIALKMMYMGLKTYFSKNWQLIYVILVLLMIIELSISLWSNQSIYLLQCFRPILLCLRERSVRRFFTVCKEMVPGFVKIYFPLLFFLAIVSVFTTLLFHSAIPNRLDSYASSMFGYWILISTGDTYSDLFPPELRTSPLYIMTFFAVLIIGNFCILTMLLGVTFDTFIDHTSNQVKKETLKEYKGLLKAFSILDTDHTGRIDQKTFEMVIHSLKPNLNDEELLLYFELASHGETTVNLIDFLDLKGILAYEFHLDDDSANQILEESRFSTLQKDLCVFLKPIVSNQCYVKFMKAVAIFDFLLLLFDEDPVGQGITICTYLLILADFIIKALFQKSMSKFWRSITNHEKVAVVGVTVHWALIAGFFPFSHFLTPSLMATILKLRKTARLARCWHLVQLNENLKQYFDCFFFTVPVLLQTICFALIIVFFFAILGMELFGNKVCYFDSPYAAFLTMLQLFFSADALDIIEKSSSHGPSSSIGIFFFVVYYLIGVCLCFNLINSIIIQIYGQTMDGASHKRIQEERAKDEKLQIQIFERVTQKQVVNMMMGKKTIGASFLSRLRLSNKATSHSSSANMRRQITGTAKKKASLEELTKIQKYADKLKYKVDLIKMQEDIVRGKQGLLDFEHDVHFSLRSNKKTQKVMFKNGEHIIHMGDIGRTCFCVHEGAVELKYLGEEVRILEKGKLFGEEMLLSRLPYEFDCVAKGDVTLLLFDSKTILKDFDSNMVAQLANKAIQSVVEIEEAHKRICSSHLVGQLPLKVSKQPGSLPQNMLKRVTEPASPLTLRVRPTFEDMDTLSNSIEPSPLNRSMSSRELSPVSPRFEISLISTDKLPSNKLKANSNQHLATKKIGNNGEKNLNQNSPPTCEILEMDFDPFYWCFDDKFAEQCVKSPNAEGSWLKQVAQARSCMKSFDVEESLSAKAPQPAPINTVQTTKCNTVLQQLKHVETNEPEAELFQVGSDADDNNLLSSMAHFQLELPCSPERLLKIEAKTPCFIHSGADAEEYQPTKEVSEKGESSNNSGKRSTVNCKETDKSTPNLLESFQEESISAKPQDLFVLQTELHNEKYHHQNIPRQPRIQNFSSHVKQQGRAPYSLVSISAESQGKHDGSDSLANLCIKRFSSPLKNRNKNQKKKRNRKKSKKDLSAKENHEPSSRVK
mmetsp:Transcript_30353/g.40054  ORF Transcript_30353/g.40054 Transcript_30353/m.40054 type:complete len:1422 (-) Transcript_30353:382-4647(-)